VLDTSVIESLGYGVLNGNVLSDEQRERVQTHLATFVYKEVYLLDLLPFVNDNTRQLLPSDEKRAEAQKIFFTQYLKAGYLPKRVGRLSDEMKKSIEARVAMVLPSTKKDVRRIRGREEL
jgi:hypothetical protein